MSKGRVDLHQSPKDRVFTELQTSMKYEAVEALRKLVADRYAKKDLCAPLDVKNPKSGSTIVGNQLQITC